MSDEAFAFRIEAGLNTGAYPLARRKTPLVAQGPDCLTHGLATDAQRCGNLVLCWQRVPTG